MIRFLCLLFTLNCSLSWACSFHFVGADLFFEPASTALNKKSQEELIAFVSKAAKFHYIDWVEISAYTGYELVSVERLNDLAKARAELVKLAVSELKIHDNRIFLESKLPAQNKFLSPRPAENSRVEVTAHGWRTRPLVCGMCPCFEKE